MTGSGKRVPDDLRNLIGKRKERFSLGARDPSEAKRLHALKLAEVEDRWSNMRSGQRPLSSDDVASTCCDYRRSSEQLQWDIEIGASLWTARTGDVRRTSGRFLSQDDLHANPVDKVVYS
ncbi:DUF6538 domain-containing protein [Bradyrhizobium elkanii]|uniref:DUF6538 domain-containing protein n=1 Tax=Bradyrhizobium elkanii TaxID=29448 RepID=UPI003A89DD85